MLEGHRTDRDEPRVTVEFLHADAVTFEVTAGHLFVIVHVRHSPAICVRVSCLPREVHRFFGGLDEMVEGCLSVE